MGIIHFHFHQMCEAPQAASAAGRCLWHVEIWDW